MFIELMPLLKQRTLLITVARIDEKLKVNIIPAKAKEGEDEALTTPLSYTGSPEELDRELGRHLASYVDSHLALGSTLAEAKAASNGRKNPPGRPVRESVVMLFGVTGIFGSRLMVLFSCRLST